MKYSAIKPGLLVNTPALDCGYSSYLVFQPFLNSLSSFQRPRSPIQLYLTWDVDWDKIFDYWLHTGLQHIICLQLISSPIFGN